MQKHHHQANSGGALSQNQRLPELILIPATKPEISSLGPGPRLIFPCLGTPIRSSDPAQTSSGVELLRKSEDSGLFL